jgi:hypothetical protein
VGVAAEEKRDMEKSKYRVVDPDELPDADQALQEHIQFRRDVRYLAATYDDLLASYSGKWVGIYREQLVAIADTAEELIAALDAAGVSRAEAIIEHLDRETIWVL